MSRSWRIVQMACLQNEDTVDSSEFLNSTELNNKKCGQIASTNEIPVDAHLFSYSAVPDISAFPHFRTAAKSKQARDLQFANCENGSELGVVNTTTPEIIKDNYFQLEQESSAININKIHISESLSADLQNSIQLEIDNSTRPKLIENNFYLVHESPEENTDNSKKKISKEESRVMDYHRRTKEKRKWR
ncbi:hypothetical protein ILUMI_13903 [Ignelater luminosus]|uniref:Uncharacterized protein n=1 Tax=Ignelater luminosus TaxID=2038154 RepID=A0A8K0CVV8_IGNLU|nr:hypothetical protein ILUMI_13903 [Ignelater luminosus]